MRGCDMGDIFYNKTVTVYNKTTDGLMGKETWYATVLENVRLLVTKGANVSKSGMDSADAAKLYIKQELLKDCDKSYLPAKEWKRMPDKCKNFFYTFTSVEDFFVEGNTSEEKQTEDFFEYMKDKYDNCFRVTNVDRYELIPHLEVGGA